MEVNALVHAWVLQVEICILSQDHQILLDLKREPAIAMGDGTRPSGEL